MTFRNLISRLSVFLIAAALITMYSCDTDDTNPAGGDGEYTATVGAGQTTNVTLSGDTWTGVTSSDDSIATGQVTGSTLTVYGHKSGTATLTVTSSGDETATVTVTVTSASQVAGQLSFSYSDALIGSFSADGKFDLDAMSGSAAAYWLDSETIIAAYAPGSTTGTADVIFIAINTSTPTVTTYNFGQSGEAYGMFITDVQLPIENPDSLPGYALMSGSVVITSTDNNSLTGTFTAEGDWFDGTTFDTSNHIVISSGTFSVPKIAPPPETGSTGNPVIDIIYRAKEELK